MNVSDTLSVDPGRTTLGDLHPDLNAKAIRRKRLAGMRIKRPQKKILNFIFAINSLRSNGKSLAMLVIRCALGALLTVSGCFIIKGEIYPPFENIDPVLYGCLEIFSGSMLIMGLFTRLAMAVATIGFGIIASLDISNGMFDMQALMSCVACLVFLIFGAGKYSCDFLLRKAIIIRNIRKLRKKREQEMAYPDNIDARENRAE